MVFPARWSALALMLAATTVGAATLNVNPGVGTPIQDAIDASSPGDTIRIHAGTYAEAVTITKPLRLRGDGNQVTIIDPACAASTAVDVQADRVTIEQMTIRGAGFYGIDVDGRDRVKVDSMIVQHSCGTPEYGINVYQSTRVTLTRNQAFGFNDAGIYVGGIAANGRVNVKNNTCNANTRGIIVEDSAPTVIAQHNHTANNGTGIFLHNSDGSQIRRNTVGANTSVGIELDAGSDNNRVSGNEISGSPTDVLDSGTGNCWRGNSYTTGSVPPC